MAKTRGEDIDVILTFSFLHLVNLNSSVQKNSHRDALEMDRREHRDAAEMATFTLITDNL